jgi:hypothetical protein
MTAHRSTREQAGQPAVDRGQPRTSGRATAATVPRPGSDRRRVSSCDAVEALPDCPPMLTAAAARALLEIVIAAGRSTPAVTPQRDNHPDGLEA